ncbi:Hypothetical protein ZAZAV_315 [Cedratvirus Zaza IHUMI]|uniref:Uncharacterized protein n=1 Tax=Cedratvirus Zaza IHUMI TaxID=2126979 RepID=A0A2R8FEN8_9VIRU|nr:Hypothetical protein ZAZAV_315 [Cedratvirus Zaza IHUMI]
MRLGQSLKGRELLKHSATLTTWTWLFVLLQSCKSPFTFTRVAECFSKTREPNFAYTSFISTTLDPDIDLSSEFSSQRRLLKILVPTGSRVAEALSNFSTLSRKALMRKRFFSLREEGFL